MKQRYLEIQADSLMENVDMIKKLKFASIFSNLEFVLGGFICSKF